jgi:hypothetical protein
MDAQTADRIEDYLATSFTDLDREYKDGAIVERGLPDYLHGKSQLLLGAFFLALRQSHSIYPGVKNADAPPARTYLYSRRGCLLSRGAAGAA